MEGKCSSSRAASSNEAWMRARNSGVSCARRRFLEKSCFQFNATPYARVRKIGRPSLLVVSRAVALRVVHGARLPRVRGPELGIGNRRPSAKQPLTMAVIRPRLPSGDRVHRHAGEGGGHHAVHEVRAAGAQIVGQVADDRLFARWRS